MALLEGPAPSTAAVVGGGPGGLMAAEVLAIAGVAVTVYDRMPSVGRKLLVAGRGGLNLTHAEPLGDLLDRYGAARPVIEPAVRAFTPNDLRAWSASLGQDTFVGTSRRVFPDALRSTPLLRAWLARLAELGVTVRGRHTWTGWDEGGRLRFTTPEDGEVHVASDVTVLALGGASWPRSGSDGGWVAAARQAGIAVAPLRPANCGFLVDWSDPFRERFAGVPVKNVRVTVDDWTQRGEAMITETGIEGGVIYAVSAALRDAIEGGGPQRLHLDLHPDVSADGLADRLRRRRGGESVSSWLRRAGGLTPVAIGLLREATGNDLPASADALADLIKDAPITITAPASIDRAISTAGGVRLDEVDETFMLRSRPGTYVVGEMLDWEAPTGGYLLQATFSVAVVAARAALARLA